MALFGMCVRVCASTRVFKTAAKLLTMHVLG